MEREQVLRRIEEIDVELNKMLNERKTSRIFNKLIKEQRSLMVELDVIDNKTYNDDEWITNKTFTSIISLSDARLNFSKMLSKLQGVSVEEKSGVSVVKVITKWKVYYYEIHARYEIEELEFEEKQIFKLIPPKLVCTKKRQIYTAYLKNHEIGGGGNWGWRY